MDGDDDNSWGYNLGLLFKISEQWKLGVAYRSQFTIKFKGRAKYRVSRVLQPLFPATDISPRMKLPPIVSTQISANLWSKWTFASGITWTGWSVYDELAPNFENDFLIPPNMKSFTPGLEGCICVSLGCSISIQSNMVISRRIYL